MYTAKGHIKKDNGHLAQQYLPLVQSQAKLLYKKINYNVDLEDLIQSGVLGLLDALEKYKESDSAQFETYAKIRIYGAMVDQLRSLDPLGQEDRALLKKIAQTENELQHTQAGKVSTTDIANKCSISIKKYHELMQLQNSSSVISHDQEEVKYLIDEMADQAPSLESKTIKHQLQGVLAKEIDILPQREKDIMGLYYQEELTLKEIAHVLELTEARVSQLHSQIIKKLKTKMVQYI
jgi:RNA polymerase sigma factor for flagellar operon FliA